ncbi:probable protein phosphatase 2C 26 isoform X1 [Elaeis guineensis]|uniref:Protein phosphatase n=1 Tax=Elaeis guineensis var. tenera TaxID=51953 RepID=A0A6I9R5K3_ELAGV|nr:probable protein phosphatase 2C 1 isoform X1 [Elaeis guineensis]
MANPTSRLSIPHSHRCFLSSPPRYRLKPSSSPKKWPWLSSALRQVRSEMSFSVGTCLIPHPEKADRGGEDAFFVSSYNGGVLAIADGVSGWAEQNVNPALFSQELMSNASGLVMDEEVNYDPQILMRKAHAATSSVGSATVIIAMLEKNGTLKIANVGDCGLRVLRKGQVIFSTPPQEHYFDCPYQLSSEIIGQTYLDAMVCTIELMEGDTIVMGSDGLFDNVFDHEIVSTTSRFKDAVEAAKALADLARDNSMDVSFDSPYSIEARSRGFDVPLWKKILGRKLTGGKPDDITVIVGQVISSLNDKKTEEALLKQKDLS